MTEIQPGKRARPLSPHLQVYKPQLTSGLSILHRMTGVALAIGTLLVVWLLMAAANGENAYNMAMGCLSSPVGLVFLFGWSAALSYHLCNGIRHLIWDTGHLFKIKNAYRAGYVVLACAAILTALIWCTAYKVNNNKLAPVDAATLASKIQQETEILR